MISDEKSRYKSWGSLKKQMNDLLCDALKDRISYFYTSYHEVHNAYGRATINFDQQELVAFSWITGYQRMADVAEQYKKMKHVPSALEDFRGSMRAYQAARTTLMKEKWMPDCTLCEGDFIHSLTIYLKTDVASALVSDNYILRVLAYMDRRVGKRTLLRIKDNVAALPEWVQQFYRLRCEHENIESNQ